ncbi:kinetochore-associated Ndc80 complex subunit ndc80 [Knufia fluminis]|uniref:Kinetochore protein NDC80 n=1 Tax=Knufia fluminis TaxID=191047 RepID=A0AAN8EJ67_9EURO|nr:kinetochore-associated Ndc80 complex subunit ndc80 [Knufia fluminis]
MSQPTGLFSVRRPRETLGPIQNFSGIPQPASAMKRTSSSQDMRAPYTGQHMRSTSINTLQRPAQPNFHRSSSGGDLAQMGQSTVRRSTMNPFAGSGSVSAHRQSLAPNQLFGSQTPASATMQRRSSIYSRPSAAGPFGSQTFFSQQAPVKRADPRVPMGKALREKMSQELQDYLSQNGFEVDMKHTLRPTSTTAPTQMDFNNIFQWLYRRIDPSYKFQKNIDTELPQLMKQLRYPYGTDISKSHIYPITPQHWPKFLLMFHWIMQLATMLDNFTRGAYDDACVEAGVDISGDRIVFHFLFSAYQQWLQVGPDEDDDAADAALLPHKQLMNEEFSAINARYEGELKALEEENEKLKAQIEEIERGQPDVAKLDKHFKILEDDKKKFEDYNSNVQAKIEKYQSRMKILEGEISKTEADLEQVESERRSLQQSVDEQGLNIQDIDRMNTERERLTKAHDDAITTLEETNKAVLEKEIEASRRLEDLEAIAKRYNMLGYQTSLIPTTASNAKGQDFELVLQLTDTTNNFSSSTHRRSRRSPDNEQSDRLLAGPLTGYQPQSLLPAHMTDLRGTTRTTLLTLRKSITERRRLATDHALSDRDLIDSVSEILQEKNAEIDNLNYKLSMTKELYNQLKDEHNTSYTQMTTKREKTEKELSKMRDGLERGVVELEQREMEVQLAWEGMKQEADRVREEVHGGVERILEDVVRFKLHIKEGLEVFEGWVGEEVEGELMEDGASYAEDGEVYE